MSPTSIHIGARPGPLEEVAKAKETEKRAEEPKEIISQLNDFLARFTPVKTTDKVSFFRLLATMINAGISIVKALHILEDQIENVHFKKVIADIAKDIEMGKSLSGAMGEFSDVFNPAQIGMVEAGEASGQLNQTLLQMAKEAEKSATLTSRIKGAMIYPAVVIVIMLGAGYVVMTYVMPRIKEMFESLGSQQLPGVTLALISTSDFLVASTLGIPNSLLIFLLLVLLFFVFMWWKKTEYGRFIWGEIVLYIPIFGKVSKKVSLAHFCRSLSTLVGSGVSIIKALRITASSVPNAMYERRINQIADDVKQGITMAENMEDDEKYFPSMVVGMINVAEQTAQIDKIAQKLADYFEEEVDETVKGLSSIIEPLIIVILGGAIAFLVVAVMLPILSASDLAVG